MWVAREGVPAFGLEHYRVRVAAMSASELHGILAQYAQNVMAGTMPPNLGVALREAAEERAGDIRTHTSSVTHRPNKVPKELVEQAAQCPVTAPAQ